MQRFGLSAIALVFLFTAVEAQAGDVKWSLAKGHSYIGFSVRHLGITNVRGEFKEYDSEIYADPRTGKVSSLEATVKADSIDTGIAGRDGHLKSDDFFNTAEYPSIKVKTKSIKWKGNEVTAKADLTIRDITKEVTFTGNLIGTQKVNFGDGDQLRAGYELSAVINRQEFGLKFNRMAEGAAVVADNVKIVIEVEASHRLTGES